MIQCKWSKSKMRCGLVDIGTLTACQQESQTLLAGATIILKGYCDPQVFGGGYCACEVMVTN